MYFKAQVPTRPAYRVMTVNIDMSDGDPSTWATYADDAVGMTVGSDDWDDFIGHYPCLLKNGVEQGKLKRNNFAYFEDGTTAVITGDAGDVMIAFPRRGVKMSVSGNILTISVTDEDNATGFDYSAFSYKGNECSHVYQGAFEGYYDLTSLRSVYNKYPSTNMAIGTFRNYAQANGTGYEQRTYFPLVYLQCLYMLKYKGQNSQLAIGRGYVGGSSTLKTGIYTYNKGMDYGNSSSSSTQMKLFGIEDFWGNVYDFVDGIHTDGNRVAYVADGNFNDSGTGYVSTNSPMKSTNWAGYMRYIPIHVTPKMGFWPKINDSNQGTSDSFFCDQALIQSKVSAICGGAYNSGLPAGVFHISLSVATTTTSTLYGGRLSYFKLKS